MHRLNSKQSQEALKPSPCDPRHFCCTSKCPPSSQEPPSKTRHKAPVVGLKRKQDLEIERERAISVYRQKKKAIYIIYKINTMSRSRALVYMYMFTMKVDLHDIIIIATLFFYENFHFAWKNHFSKNNNKSRLPNRFDSSELYTFICVYTCI